MTSTHQTISVALADDEELVVTKRKRDGADDADAKRPRLDSRADEKNVIAILEEAYDDDDHTGATYFIPETELTDETREMLDLLAARGYSNADVVHPDPDEPDIGWPEWSATLFALLTWPAWRLPYSGADYFNPNMRPERYRHLHRPFAGAWNKYAQDWPTDAEGVVAFKVPHGKRVVRTLYLSVFP